MAVIQDYINHGWSLVPIPPGTKGPASPGWNTRVGAITDPSILPAGYGVGLGHAFSGTMAFDIDDWERTRARGIDVDALYAAPDAVTILSGRPGHGKLLYRMPFGLVLPTRKFTDEIGRDANGKTQRVTAFELRCGTMDEARTVQDVLPPSIHPGTGQPYQWGGSGHWTRLPMVPQQLLDIWLEALKDARPVKVDGVDSSWDEIKDALSHVNPDIPRDDWIEIGMALHWAGEQTFHPDQAFAIWDQWSSTGAKYPGEREMLRQWRSFDTLRSGKCITLGTLFHLARQYGWTRPHLDAATLFGSVEQVVRPEDVIHTMRPAPPDIDLDLWPAPLVQRAREVSEAVGCDPIVPLWAGLSAVCGVIDAQTRLELMPGFKVPPVLWLMTIGDPGDRKSPGSRPMLSTLKDIEASDRPRFAQEVLSWEAQEAAYSVAKKAFLDFAGSPEGMLGGEAPAVPPLPDRPVPLKITVSDITSQKLVRQAADRPRGLLCYLDEMNSWVQKLTNRMSGEDRSAWVVGYEAERYEMDRVGSGAIHCENFAVSIYGNMQPQVLDENFEALASDGLLQRFIPAVLRHDKTKIGNPIPEYLTTADAWDNTLRLIFALPQSTYKLSPDAYKVFRTFQEWYEGRMRSERLMRSSTEFVTAFGKITGLAGRLALIFHVIESPFTPLVSEDVMRRVVQIIRRFIVPTYRYVFDRDGSFSAFDAWVVEYVIQHADTSSVTMSEIKRSGRRQLEKSGARTTWQQSEYVMSAMYLLEKMGWVARIDDGSREAQGVAEWLVNPHLRVAFQAYRESVVRAKVEKNEERLAKTKGASIHIPYAHGVEDLGIECVRL